VSLDGSTRHVQDSEANDRAYGRASSTGRLPAWPLIRFVMLIENGTHAPFAAAMSGWRTSENVLGYKVLGKLSEGMLCLADRLFYSYEMWNQAVSTGADLLWRVQKKIPLPRLKTFADRSYLSPCEWTEASKRGPDPCSRGRVHRQGSGTSGTLSSNHHPARSTRGWGDRLAQLYARRWSIEVALREMKSFLRGDVRSCAAESPNWSNRISTDCCLPTTASAR
jgi:hypothetical protein